MANEIVYTAFKLAKFGVVDNVSPFWSETRSRPGFGLVVSSKVRDRLADLFKTSFVQRRRFERVLSETEDMKFGHYTVENIQFGTQLMLIAKLQSFPISLNRGQFRYT